MKLGSQIFIKHITESGLAARNRGLQEGDLILQVSPGSCWVGVGGAETEAKEGSAMFPAPGIISSHLAPCQKFLVPPSGSNLLDALSFTILFVPGSFQINGVSSANLSLSDTRRLIEKSEGELTLLVLRDSGQFLVNIPPAVSDSDSSLMEGQEPKAAASLAPGGSERDGN